MIFRREQGGVLWIDLENPTTEEVRDAAGETGVNPRIATELTSPSPLPLVVEEAGAVLLTTHFPLHEEKGEVHNQEIDLVVGKNFVITASYEVVPAIHGLRKILETNEALGTDSFSTGALVEIIFNHLFAGVRDYATNIATRLSHIERDMFTGKERATVRPISELSRVFLHLESAIGNQEESLTLFLEELERKNHFESKERMARILTGRTHLARLVATHRAVTTELRETNAALLSVSQNEVMKTLTVITFIMLPLALITNIFEMTLPGVPFSDNPHAFWIIIAIMLAVSGFLLIVFTRKRWL